jgi:hypothetical protein
MRVRSVVNVKSREIADDLVILVVFVKIHTAYIHGCISRRGGDDNLLGTTFQMG